MRRSILFVAASVMLASCGQSGGDNGTANQANAAATAAPAHKHPTYCFFPDPADVKGWAAKIDRDGNVVVTGKARLEDRRYMARLSQTDVAGTSGSVWLTMTTNTTGFGAQNNWWDVDTTIPNSANVTQVNVMCGTSTLATLQVPRTASAAPSTTNAG